jgi:hypothetical protein
MNKHTKVRIPLEDLTHLIGDSARVSTSEADILDHCYDCWPVAVKDRQAGESNHRPDVVVLKSGTAQFSPISFNRLSTKPVACLKGNPNSTLIVRQACMAASLYAC